MKKQYALLFPACALVFGCASPVPVAVNFPISQQKVARTAHHWDVVAQDVVAQTTAAIEANPVLQKRGVFIPAAERSTAFNVAFRNFLINHMVSRGMPVSVCKSTQSSGTGFAMEGPDIEVLYEARVIGHGGNMPKYIPGTFTALASGVRVIHNISENMSSSSGWAAGIGLAALADVAVSNLSLPTSTELIVTTTITENNRYIMRKSDIYYVPDADAKLFSQRISQRSSCPQDKDHVAKSDHTTDDVDVEASRQALIAREMNRWNPNWQAAPVSYAY
jgi:hypothetical protein